MKKANTDEQTEQNEPKEDDAEKEDEVEKEDEKAPKEGDAKNAEIARAVLDHCLFHEKFLHEFAKWARTWGVVAIAAAAVAILWGKSEFKDIKVALEDKRKELEKFDTELSDLRRTITTTADQARNAQSQIQFADSLVTFTKERLLETRQMTERAASNLIDSETRLNSIQSNLLYHFTTNIAQREALAVNAIERRASNAQSEFQALRMSVNQLTTDTLNLRKSYAVALEGGRQAKSLVSEIVALESTHATAIQMPDLEPPFTNRFVLSFWSADVGNKTMVSIHVTSNGLPLNKGMERVILKERKAGGSLRITSNLPDGAVFDPENVLRARTPIPGTPFSVTMIEFLRRYTQRDVVFFKVFYKRQEDED